MAKKIKKKGNMRRFVGYYKPLKKLLFIDMFFAIVIAASAMVFPLVLRMVTDVQSIGDITADDIMLAGIIMAIVISIRGFAMFVVQYYGHIMGTKIEETMRNDIYKHIQNQPVSYFDNNESGKIIQRIVGDLRDVSEFAHHGPEDILISVMTSVGTFVILSTINIMLASLLTGLVLLATFAIIASRQSMKKSFAKNKSVQGSLTAIISNNILGARETKAFANEEYEIERFKKVASDFQTSWRRTYKVMAFFGARATIMLYALTSGLSILSIQLYANGVISFPEMTAFILYAGYAIQPIMKMANFIEQLQRGRAGIDRFYQLVDTQPLEVQGEQLMDNSKGSIVFKDVSFEYDKDSQVLSNFNLDIKSGEKIALVGPTGVGKTSIISLIPRFYEISKGSIEIDGIDLNDFNLKSLRKNIGIVQQKPYMFYGTIKENIKYGKLEADMEEIVEAAKKAEIHDFITSLKNGYDSQIGENGVKLSGGQMQRIALARVFLSRPKILVLDEATSALDNRTEARVQLALDKLLKGRTSITVAHRLSTVRNSDRIIVLGKDGIVEQGSHDQLMTNDGIYKQLYETNLLET